MKVNNFPAVPFDKGVGFYPVEKNEDYERVNDILAGSQFEAVNFTFGDGRSNAKELFLADKDCMNPALKKLCSNGRVSEGLWKSRESSGGQYAGFDGFARVYKTDNPVRAFAKHA